MDNCDRANISLRKKMSGCSSSSHTHFVNAGGHNRAVSVGDEGSEAGACPLKMDFENMVLEHKNKISFEKIDHQSEPCIPEEELRQLDIILSGLLPRAVIDELINDVAKSKVGVRPSIRYRFLHI